VDVSRRAGAFSTRRFLGGDAMRMSRHFPRTRREARPGAVASHALLEQAGFVRATDSAGIYVLAPLGWRVHRNVCDVVFEEMEREGVQNLSLPVLQSRELWEKTGRWAKYLANDTMFVATERHSGNEFGLAPTAEEVVTALAASEVSSWRDLPLILHQIGPKFRDEIRPRLGLLRCREFTMSDAYSFDADEAGMRRSFETMRTLYARVFRRVGLTDCIAVQADSGAIGGQGSAEFMAVCDIGEDVLLVCGRCDYGANVEKADGVYPAPAPAVAPRPLRVEPTPGVCSVEELGRFFPDVRPRDMVKTIVFSVADAGASREVAVCIRGDLDVSERKLSNALGGAEATPADATTVERVTGAAVGFAGPIGLRIPILYDRSVVGLSNFLCGVNQTDRHALDVNFGRDLDPPADVRDLHTAVEGHGCKACGEGTLEAKKGVEVGHVFMLQQRYAEQLGLSFSDGDGKTLTPWMGCYGIGTTRLVQAVVEQNRDADGIIWPESVAPYLAHVVCTRSDDPAQTAIMEKIEAEVRDVLCDDRAAGVASAGVKFKDADLVGCPWRVTIGRAAAAGEVEVRDRRTKETSRMGVDAAVEFLRARSAARRTGGR
jgi:prolyl-tRNA synthetase